MKQVKENVIIIFKTLWFICLVHDLLLLVMVMVMNIHTEYTEYYM